MPSFAVCDTMGYIATAPHAAKSAPTAIHRRPSPVRTEIGTVSSVGCRPRGNRRMAGTSGRWCGLRALAAEALIDPFPHAGVVVLVVRLHRFDHRFHVLVVLQRLGHRPEALPRHDAVREGH